MEPDLTDAVVVVGAGIAGLSCARTLGDAGVRTVVLDRGRAVGGRMASRTLHGRPVDLGASYLTARDPDFAATVADWCARGVARPWTDEFAVVSPDGVTGPKQGPMRYAAATGLRSLVQTMADDLVRDGRPVHVVPDRPVTAIGADGPSGPTVDDVPVRAVALAMPDPQALRLLAGGEPRPGGWEPVVAVAAGYPENSWPFSAGAFVHDSAVLSFIADDGHRRGDGAPVLVAHTTAPCAGRHLDDPAGAVPEVTAELARLLGVPPVPTWTYAHRWTFARPTAERAADHHLGESMIGFCGDGWGSPKVEGAWLSGRALGRALAAALR